MEKEEDERRRSGGGEEEMYTNSCMSQAAPQVLPLLSLSLSGEQWSNPDIVLVEGK